MLKRKHYFLTLSVAIMVFFVIFTIGYYYIQISSHLPQNTYDTVVTKDEKSIDALASTESDTQLTVQPSTRIRLHIVDEHDNKIEDKVVDASALLGLSEADIKDKFKGYELVVFDERQIALKKILPVVDKVFEYTLGIQNNQVCIVQKDGDIVKGYLPLGMSASHFSRYTYSLLLKEQIEITSLQKDALLTNPNYIETILQSYEEE